jgi:hypothetical protein
LTVGPFFHVSCIKEFSHEIDKSSVMNVFAECLQEQFMVEFIKTLGDISLEEPGGSYPVIIDFSECCVAAAFRTKSM